MKSRLGPVALLAILGAGGVWSAGFPREALSRGGWGIDACLSVHVPRSEVPGYLRLLHTSGIRWLRERELGAAGPDVPARRDRLDTWREMKGEGFRVVAFASLPRNIPVTRSDGQLPENLIEVFRQSQDLARLAAGKVDAWETNGEPETFYMKDLPDRVVAYQKAVYLGIKSGAAMRPLPIGGLRNRPRARRAPGVLMGALAFPPGPWLEAAAENGIYDYTDAVNFHHYGFGHSLPEVIQAQRAFAARWTHDRALPLWLTEVGLNNVPYGDFENPSARQAQADYLVTCARAAIAGRLAVFMPFVLVHRGDPFGMTNAADDVRPAWRDYRDFTRRESLPAQPVFAPPVAPDPVILQWIPDEVDGGIASKISRSYWFERSGPARWLPLEGSVHVYNLSAASVKVRLVMTAGRDLVPAGTTSLPTEALELAPFSRKIVPLTFRAPTAGYRRETVRLQAQTLSDSDQVTAISPLSFTLETAPAVDLPHRAEPLALARPERSPAGAPPFASISGAAPLEPAEELGPWLGINGTKISALDSGKVAFHVTDRKIDPLSPPMAIAALPGGLPDLENGFLHLVATTADGKPASIRVDLIDADGQRFSIVENLGRNPLTEVTASVLMAYADFHPWVFGRCVAGRERLDPRRVREIQLRFFDAGKATAFRVQLEAVGFPPKPASQKTTDSPLDFQE